MIGAIASFSAMAIAGRELGKTIPTFEIMMYRSIIGLLIIVAIGLYYKSLNGIKFTNLSLEEYSKIEDKWRNEKLWIKNGNKWEKKYPVK